MTQAKPDNLNTQLLNLKSNWDDKLSGLLIGGTAATAAPLLAGNIAAGAQANLTVFLSSMAVSALTVGVIVAKNATKGASYHSLMKSTGSALNSMKDITTDAKDWVVGTVTGLASGFCLVGAVAKFSDALELSSLGQNIGMAGAVVSSVVVGRWASKKHAQMKERDNLSLSPIDRTVGSVVGLVNGGVVCGMAQKLVEAGTGDLESSGYVAVGTGLAAMAASFRMSALGTAVRRAQKLVANDDVSTVVSTQAPGPKLGKD